MGSFSTMPNLRTLEMTVGAANVDLDLAALLPEATSPALEHLHLHLGSGLARVSGAPGVSAKGVPGGVFGRTLTSATAALSPRLREISVEGEDVVQLSPAAFKNLRSRRLQFNVIAKRALEIERDLFLNLGEVENVTVFVEGSKDAANVETHLGFGGEERSLGNPVTSYAPGHPRAVFLRDLKVSGNVWTCECDDIG